MRAGGKGRVWFLGCGGPGGSKKRKPLYFYRGFLVPVRPSKVLTG
jgi:hypothetical protein